MKKRTISILGLFIALIMIATIITPPLIAADNGESYKGRSEAYKHMMGRHRFQPPRGLHPGDEFKVGPYSGTITENGIENLYYKNEQIATEIDLGEFIRGGVVGNTMFAAYSNGYIAIHNEVITLKARNVTIYLSAEIIKKADGIAVLRTEKMLYLARYVGEWQHDEVNNIVTGTGVVALHPAPHLERLVFIHRITSWNITDSGIENISLMGHYVLSIRFDATTFLGSMGRINKVLFWDSAKVHVREGVYGVTFDVFSENISIEVSNEINVVQVTPTIAVLVYNNNTCGVITGRLEYGEGVITAHKFAKVVVGPRLLENMFRERHRYRDVLVLNDSGEFHGRYIEGVITDAQITNYTIRGITVADVIDLGDVLGNDYNVAKHGAVIQLFGENGRANIIDAVTGPIIVKSTNATTIIVKLPEANVTLEDVNETMIVYRIDDVPVILKVYNGSMEVDGLYVYITLESDGVFVLHSPPVYGVNSEAMLKLYEDEGLKAAAEGLRPDIKINAQISGNKVIARVSGHGEGTVMDIELDPSIGINPENMKDIKVFFDGKEVTLKPVDEISSLEEPSYSIYFDGMSFHLLVAVPHFSEHTIEVALPGMAMTIGEGGAVSEDYGEPNIDKEVLIGGAVAAIVIIGVIAGILIKRK